jgi:hypothetical protein
VRTELADGFVSETYVASSDDDDLVTKAGDVLAGECRHLAFRFWECN